MASTRRLIEEWLPIAEIGIESIREKASMAVFPALNRLHVWWARRPLVASRAAVMASLLPADADREKFMHALGIHGDPVKARAEMEAAKCTGTFLKEADVYGYPRAFRYSPSQEEREWLAKEAQKLGVGPASMLDPTAGGGAIPFESLRLGIDTYANDLNPVAVFVEKMTIDVPMQGPDVLPLYRNLCTRFIKKSEALYEGIFPKEPEGVQILGYLWARTMRCPHCGGVVPLSPNWRLASDGTGVRLHPDEGGRTCSFEIVHSIQEQSAGTVGRGRAICPYPDCGRVIGGGAVKRFAQEEELGEQLYAVAYKKPVRTFSKSGKEVRTKWERGYRAPRPEDDIMDAVKARLAEKLPEWEERDILPTERFDDLLIKNTRCNTCSGNGVYFWRDLFSPRQLYCHGVSVEVFREILDEEQAKGVLSEAQKAAFGYLAISLDTVLNYGTRSCRWSTGMQRTSSFFDRQSLPFLASYAEMPPLVVGTGYTSAFEKTEKCIVELMSFLHDNATQDSLRQLKDEGAIPEAQSFASPRVTLSCQTADCLWHIFDRSIDVVILDPPYYDNVMYAEISDFFYVWLKRTAGRIHPELFTLASTDKENEAVANPAMFKGRKRPNELAGRRYRERMAAILAECRRVLTDDGILVLMFTHKATSAWDALAKSLFDAGFKISASWPVDTEADSSLNIRGRASARSTIFLVCRPRLERDESSEVLFWEEVEPSVRRRVFESARKNRDAGIHGIDLYLSCFGPALEEFSKHWPVRRGIAMPGREDPYEATLGDVLQTARVAVKDWRIREILKSRPDPTLDPLLSWFVLAWDTFKAPSFPYDEGLNLARVTGLDLDRDIVDVIAEKEGSDIILWDSATRAAKSSVGPANGSKSMLDALHQAANAARARSMDSAIGALREMHLDTNPAFKDALCAVLEVLPISGNFSGQDVSKDAEPFADDFDIFEVLRMVAFKDIGRPQQLSLIESRASAEKTL